MDPGRLEVVRGQTGNEVDLTLRSSGPDPSGIEGIYK